MLKDQSLYDIKNRLEKRFSKNTDDKNLCENRIVPAPKTRFKWGWMIAIGVLCTVGVFSYVGKKIHQLEHKQREARHALRKLKYGAVAKAPILGGMPVPVELRNIPFAEADGIVLATKTIKIRNVFAPYNGCIFKNDEGSGYHLVFRYDQINSNDFPTSFFSHMGIVSLNDQFEQTAQEFKRINTRSYYSEDPRVVKIGQEYYISYNDLQPHSPHCRSIRIAHFNLQDGSIQYSTNLDLHFRHIEKNWNPFEYLNEDHQPQLMFEYSLSPHKLLELPDPRINRLNHLIFPDHPSPPILPWQEIWGDLRGGAPPQKIGDAYLGFFHSSMTDDEEVIWYLIGAYTFEATPPFRITAVSKCPILFEGIYDTPHLNTASCNKRILFPMGFVMEERNGKQLIQLSCGENDSGIKLVTIDKDALLKNMIKCEDRPY